MQGPQGGVVAFLALDFRRRSFVCFVLAFLPKSRTASDRGCGQCFGGQQSAPVAGGLRARDDYSGGLSANVASAFAMQSSFGMAQMGSRGNWVGRDHALVGFPCIDQPNVTGNHQVWGERARNSPDVGQIWPGLSVCGPISAEIGPNPVHVARNSVELSRHRQKLARYRPTLA